MINTERNTNRSTNMEGDIMTNEEMIQKIIDRTGVTKEQAQEALDKYNGDLLDAMIYVERTYGQASKQTYASYTAGAAQQTEQTQQTAPTDFNEQKEEQPRPQFDWGGAARKVGNALMDNSLVIYYGGKAVATIPLLIVLIVALMSFNTVLIAIIVSMFFGVSYRVSGSGHASMRANTVIDTIHGMIKTLRSSFSCAK